MKPSESDGFFIYSISLLSFGKANGRHMNKKRQAKAHLY